MLQIFDVVVCGVDLRALLAALLHRRVHNLAQTLNLAAGLFVLSELRLKDAIVLLQGLVTNSELLALSKQSLLLHLLVTIENTYMNRQIRVTTVSSKLENRN